MYAERTLLRIIHMETSENVSVSAGSSVTARGASMAETVAGAC